MNKLKHIAINWEKYNLNLKLTLSFLCLLCLFLLHIWETPYFTGLTGVFWYSSRLVHRPSFPSERDPLQPRPCPLLHFLSRETSTHSEFSTISHFNCFINLLTKLLTSSLTFVVPIYCPFYRQNVTPKCKSNMSPHPTVIPYCLCKST